MTAVTTMEPMLPEESKGLENLAIDLVAKASTLAGKVNPLLAASIGDLVRSMNCYYSNLIEGHHTYPVDIDRALANDYAQEPERRNLQKEARAHIEVQRLIDRGEAPTPVVSTEFILWVHREFCQRLPDDLLWVENLETHERLRVIPGELRQWHVKVGRLVRFDLADIREWVEQRRRPYGS